MDYEDFFNKLLAQFKIELNAQIDAMNTKRTDTALSYPSEWYEESLDDTAKSYDFFAFIGTANAVGRNNGRALAVDYEIEIDYFLPDEQDQLLQKKIKRLNMCLMRASQNVWRKVGYSQPVEINLLTPFSAQLNNNSRTYKLLGINLKFTMVFN